MGVGASGKTVLRVTAPLRVSFLGGGCDFESFFSKHVGLILSCAIRKYLVRGRGGSFDNSPAAACEYFGQGLGASSAAYVAHVVWEWTEQNKEPFDRKEIANKAYLDELSISTVGKQDHLACALGGLNLFQLYKSRVIINPFSEEAMQWLESICLLWPTGSAHNAQEILIQQNMNADMNEAMLLEMKALVMKGARAIGERDSLTFGSTILRAWEIKKKLASGISNYDLDNQFARCSTVSGCLGGKLLGAGNGGWFLLIFSDQIHRDKALLELEKSEPLRISRVGVHVV